MQAGVPAHTKHGVLNKATLPEINFSHLRNLTDDTGILQHAMFAMPNRKEGYCIDDNSRALLLMVLVCNYTRSRTASQLLPVYLSFVHYMQTADGYFRNFLNYDKSCVEDRGSEDSFGRTIMALGYLVNKGPSTLLIRTGAEIFTNAYPHIENLVSVRGIANSLIGLCSFINYNYPDDMKKDLVIRLSDKMLNMYNANKQNEWHWFEPVLTYDNAILPLALLHAHEITRNENYLAVARESLGFLESKTFFAGRFRPVGNQGWCHRGEHPAQFDQQGIDAMAMVLCYQQAFLITREPQYLEKMQKTHWWFLGENDLALSLYDPFTGGCSDGLHADGINYNQGAESTIAYWISHIIVSAEL